MFTVTMFALSVGALAVTVREMYTYFKETK